MKQLRDKTVYSHTYQIKKSRFMTYICQIESKAELEQFIQNCFQKDARHNCYAYKIGLDGHATQGYHNDGEPQGTSGDALLKMLTILNITNIAIFVVRYFGGIKLGSGPLTRSYLEGAKTILKDSNIFLTQPNFTANFYCDIKNQSTVLAFLNQKKIDSITKSYNQNVVIFSIKNCEPVDLSDIAHLIHY